MPADLKNKDIFAIVPRAIPLINIVYPAPVAQGLPARGGQGALPLYLLTSNEVRNRRALCAHSSAVTCPVAGKERRFLQNHIRACSSGVRALPL